MQHLLVVLAAAGTAASDVLKKTNLLTGMPDFFKAHAVYAKVVPSDLPVRSCVVVAALPRG